MSVPTLHISEYHGDLKGFLVLKDTLPRYSLLWIIPVVSYDTSNLFSL